MLIFVRGSDPFQFGVGEIYLKMLTGGQPVAITHDRSPKMAPVFAEDGSRIVYTSFTDAAGWISYGVPLAGGQPTMVMRNAAGLTWTSPRRVLFSEVKSLSTLQMAIVTSTDNREDSRDIYIPTSPVGMAHFSALSPDGRWVLVVEMDSNGWLPCRLVPFDGSSRGSPVGPKASCTAAAWSPDGRWMYFAAGVNGASHIWRQQFPDKPPEQITFGVTEERGIAVDPDGKSLITSIGAMQSTIWYHDEHGDRPVSVEGYAYRPLVSRDGKKVYYLVRRTAQGSFWIGELWMLDLSSGQNTRLLPDFLIRNYHVSSDGKYVVFDRFDESGQSSIWLAAVEKGQAPRRLSLSATFQEQRPFFGSSGAIYYVQELSQGRGYLWRVKADGSDRQKLSDDPITYLVNISPDEKWALVWKADAATETIAIPIGGGKPRVFCDCATEPIFQDSPRVNWSGDGKELFVNIRCSGMAMGAAAIVVPLRFGEVLPVLQPGKSPTAADLMGIPRVREIPEVSIAPGPTGGSYAFTRETQQRNLFRIFLAAK